MNKEISQDQTAWNNGFDYFFERKEEQKLTLVGELIFGTVWQSGFIAASNYCEHLLKEARGTTQ
jgi:hypothetical protein